MADTPAYTSGFRVGTSTWISASNNNLDGSGTLNQLIAGGANGSLVQRLRFKGLTNANNQCLINIFLSLNNGVTKGLVHQIRFELWSTYGLAGSGVSYEVETANLDWVLPNTNAILYFACTDIGTTSPIEGFAFVEDF